LTAACNYLDRHDNETVKLRELGHAVGLSPFHLQRMFRRCLGITPREYQQARRIDRFRQQVAQGDTVTTALYQAGFGSSSRLYEGAHQQLGMTPAALRNGGKNIEIRYSISDSPLDKMLVAVTNVGLCAISFGLLESELEDDLTTRFPLADLRRDQDGLGSVVQKVLNQLTEHPAALNLPLDVRATAFQKRVWTVLQKIPRGETRSYGEIAKSLGEPNAARAVARACSQNPVAVVIPCHRVVGESGRLTGYRWGLQRKQDLLTLEGNSHFLGQPRK
jgi:AraC family transcriptional regulator of adaptative response/methylated-DNA-[protein]-cysteine methyltransferase